MTLHATPNHPPNHPAETQVAFRSLRGILIDCNLREKERKKERGREREREREKGREREGER